MSGLHNVAYIAGVRHDWLLGISWLKSTCPNHFQPPQWSSRFITGESYAFRPFLQKIMKNIGITRDSSEWSRNREKVDFTEPDGQHYMADRPFSHVSTVIRKFYNLYHHKYIFDRKNVSNGAKYSASSKTSFNRPVSHNFQNPNREFDSIFYWLSFDTLLMSLSWKLRSLDRFLSQNWFWPDGHTKLELGIFESGDYKRF